jgi:hypothetical protein
VLLYDANSVHHNPSSEADDRLASQTFTFCETRGSLLRLKEPTTGRYPESSEFIRIFTPIFEGPF